MTVASTGRGRRCLPASLVALLAVLLVGVAVSASTPWWQDAVFYEVFVRSFADSDGDGIGDLRGLIEHLDYLNDGDPATHEDLGVTALWLMPIFPSPSYHGYDVIDYYDVEPDYGTLDDLRNLLTAAHNRGIRVILDLVLNHTSNRNPWFVASGAPSSSYRDWYVWSKTDPGYLGPWGEEVWHRALSGYYYGIFSRAMPDLNYRNPAVSIRVFDVVRYWLDEIGVDGFRLDAVRHLIEVGQVQQNTPATHFWLKGLNAVAKGWEPNAVLVGEVWDSPSAIAPYLDHEMDLCFEFSLADAILGGVRFANARGIEDALRIVQETYPPGQYATFLSNHDQERTMTALRGNVGEAKLAASILLTLPGTPFLYYGEEIGMTGTKPDERIRTPMQWAAIPGVGFTQGVPWEPLQTDALERTVADQVDDPGSLLSKYQSLIALRLSHAALRDGSLRILAPTHPSVLAYARATAAERILVIHNLSSFPVQLQTADLGPSGLDAGAYRAVELLSGNQDGRVVVTRDGSLSGPDLALGPLGTLILSLSHD
jgi:alpha-amylase